MALVGTSLNEIAEPKSKRASESCRWRNARHSRQWILSSFFEAFSTALHRVAPARINLAEAMTCSGFPHRINAHRIAPFSSENQQKLEALEALATAAELDRADGWLRLKVLQFARSLRTEPGLSNALQVVSRLFEQHPEDTKTKFVLVELLTLSGKWSQAGKLAVGGDQRGRKGR